MGVFAPYLPLKRLGNNFPTHTIRNATGNYQEIIEHSRRNDSMELLNFLNQVPIPVLILVIAVLVVITAVVV